MRNRWLYSLGLAFLLGIPACGDNAAMGNFQTVQFEIQISADLLADVDGGTVLFHVFPADALLDPASAIATDSDQVTIAGGAWSDGVLRVARGVMAADFSAHITSAAGQQVASCLLLNEPLAGSGTTNISCMATSVNSSAQIINATIVGDTGSYIEVVQVQAGSPGSLSVNGPLDCLDGQAVIDFTHRDPDGDDATLTVIKMADWAGTFDIDLGGGSGPQVFDGLLLDPSVIADAETRTVTATWGNDFTGNTMRLTFWTNNPLNPNGPGGNFSVTFDCSDGSGTVTTLSNRGLQYAMNGGDHAVWVTVDPAAPNNYYLYCAYDDAGDPGWGRYLPSQQTDRDFLGIVDNGANYTVIEYDPALDVGMNFQPNSSFAWDCP